MSDVVEERVDFGHESKVLRARRAEQILRARLDYHFYREWIRNEIYGSFLTGWWVRHLARVMQEFYESWKRGERPILGICAPPQHGKSWNSEDLLAWMISQHADMKYVYAAYSKDLGERTNASIQRAMDTDRYKEAFATRLPSPGRSEGGMVRNSTQLSFLGDTGFFRNTTVEGQITGFGIDMIVLDDLLKSRQEARSKVVRDTAWDWLTDDVLTRRSKTAGIIFTTTRWHVDDPMGRMKGRFPHMKIISYPAFATAADPDGSVAAGYRKVGEPLFPEHKPLDFLLEQKQGMSAGAFEALYQQNPTIEGGDLFPVGKFQPMNVAPARETVKRWVRYWDKAGTSGGGAHTVGVLMAMLKDGRFVVEDVKRGQWSALEREQMILKTAMADNDDRFVETWVEQEPGSGGKESAERTIANLRGYVCKADKVTGSKEIRADPYAAQVQGGNVYLVKAPWNERFMDEHEVFPNGPHKDQVDATGGAFAKLAGKRVLDYANV
jgi:predicted phage terminase large subunit-like protein